MEVWDRGAEKKTDFLQSILIIFACRILFVWPPDLEQATINYPQIWPNCVTFVWRQKLLNFPDNHYSLAFSTHISIEKKETDAANIEKIRKILSLTYSQMLKLGTFFVVIFLEKGPLF